MFKLCRTILRIKDADIASRGIVVMFKVFNFPGDNDLNSSIFILVNAIPPTVSTFGCLV